MVERKNWTPAEDKRLVSALAAGKTHAEVAKLLGRPKSSISSRLNTLSNHGAPPPKALRQRARSTSNYLPALRVPTSQRPCLCCGKPFASQGPHNRMCTKCRLGATDLSPYTPHL